MLAASEVRECADVNILTSALLDRGLACIADGGSAHRYFIRAFGPGSPDYMYPHEVRRLVRGAEAVLKGVPASGVCSEGRASFFAAGGPYAKAS